MLYVVGTPIGNLEDIGTRALNVLHDVDLILCEDTRVTKKLLHAYEIETPTMSYHAQSGLAKVDKILDVLREGKSVALVSDAGTPAISDPGVQLVQKVQEEFGDEVKIVSIPGPSAVTAALSISGLPSSEFLFLGFLPHKKGRQTLFEEVAASKRTAVLYESPHRVLKALESLVEHIDDTRRVVVAREITKIHEEVISGLPQEVLEHFTEHPGTVRGEFVIMVEGRR